MRWILQLAVVVVMVVGGFTTWTADAAAQDCATASMKCAARAVTGSSDGLHDSTCQREYVRCLTRLLRFT